ncbi:MAG TPA: hypothetical protein P5121_37315, partial [Caldilineaceae bacterium]|nr:hypothetical protein [Caldilineaceae bacterium]
MSLSRFPQITNELLSAYLDGLVTDDERQLIERALTEDAEIAWRLESLRQTVQLLQSMPALALPKSFTLDAALVEAFEAREKKHERATVAVATT